MGALATLEKLVPVLLAFGCGVLLARRRTIPAANSKVFTDYAFLVAVPCFLFRNIYTSDLGALFEWRAVLGYAVTAVLAMGAVTALTMLVLRTREPRAVALRLMASVQGNTAYFGVPVFIMLFGDAAPIFPVLLFQVCVLSLVVLAVMELGRTDRDTPVPARLGRALWGSLTTPVVLACNAGILLNLIAVHVPAVLLHGFSFVGASAAPVALFALGLHLGGTGLSLRGTTWEETGIIVFKCVVFPLLAWAVCGLVFGVHGHWLAYLVLIAALPSPQNLFIFAQRYEVAVDMAAGLVVKSSVAALALLPLWAAWAAHSG
jgi:malonate transporter and related proteins